MLDALGLAREFLARVGCDADRDYRNQDAGEHDRDAGQDQRAGVDLVRIDVGGLVLVLDEGAECLGVDLLLGGIGRKQDIGLVEGLSGGNDIATVEPFQRDAGEHQM